MDVPTKLSTPAASSPVKKAKSRNAFSNKHKSQLKLRNSSSLSLMADPASRLQIKNLLVFYGVQASPSSLSSTRSIRRNKRQKSPSSTASAATMCSPYRLNMAAGSP